jgi:speckle-type POZ protein
VCRFGEWRNYHSLQNNKFDQKATKEQGCSYGEIYRKTPIRGNDQDLILIQLEELFEKMPLSVVTFNVRGRQFSAHKNILAIRSPVFSAMFQHPTKEMQTSELEVEEVNPDVFQEVLRYLYTGLTRSTTMDVMAPGLFAAADKYLLEMLKI